MRIVALDPSSTHIGWCIADRGQYRGSGVFTPKGDAEERLTAILLWVLELLKTQRPDVVAFEEPAADRANRKTDRLLANVSGLVIAAAILTQTRRVRVWPAQVKASGASKDSLIYAAAVAGKRKVKADEADAIGVWLAAEAILNDIH